MKRLLAFLISLLLLFPMISVLVAADGGAETIHVNKNDTLPDPENVPEGKVFAGWGGEDVFLSAGATYKGPSSMELTAVYVDISTKPDTKVRTETEIGLRFLTEIDKADLVALKQYTPVTYGTYIAPVDYVEAAKGVLTPAALQAAGKTYLETTTDQLYAESDTVATVAGSLVKVLQQNQYREFCAAGYIQVQYTDGSIANLTAPASAGVRLYDLALAAFCDRTEGADATHATQTAHGTYSPYSAEQLAYFSAVMDCVVDVTRFVVDTGNLDVVGPSADFFGYMPTAYRVTYEMGSFVFTVNDESSFRFDRDLGAVYAIRNEVRTKLTSQGKTSYQVVNNGCALTVVQPVDGYSGQH